MAQSIFVCTDLDRTVLPNGPQPESKGARAAFARLAAREEVTLAYVTGRDRDLVEGAITHYRLPAPEVVIADVGTSIYRVSSGGSWSFVDDWARAIGADWGGLGLHELMALLSDLKPLRAQERSKQGRFKLSYYLALHEERERLSEEIGESLGAAGVQATLIWSVDEPAGVGLLDIIPASASKFHAIEACMGYLGFDYSNTVFCGDSGNDMEVLVSPIAAVLVANAQPEVRDEALCRSSLAERSACLYVAHGGFLGMNGNYWCKII